jgi:CRISPR-associated protein Cas1
MAVVYVATPGALVQRRGERLEVRREGEKIGDVKLFDLERLVLVGQVQLTAPAIALLLDRGIDVSFLSGAGRPRGALVATTSRNVYLRLAQFDRFKDPTFRLDFARRIVRAKLAAQRRVVIRYRRNHPEAVGEAPAEQIATLAARLDAATSIDELMGFEGAASAAYFGAFGRMLRRVAFPGRRRRPAGDPANALLNLGYVLLTNELAGLLEARGFDPFIGFLHGIRYGRQSLALDLVEPFRQPVVDRLTLRLFNLGQFGPADFEGGEQGLRLLPDRFKDYLRGYEAFLAHPSEGESGPSWRDRLRGEVDGLRACIMSGEPGDPYTWPG